MILNYFKIAIRSILRNSVYSFINIAGLAIGIACSILIFLWVFDELSFDRFHANYDRLYKVHMNREFAGGIGTQPALPYPLKEAMKNKASQIKHAVITNWGEGNLLTVGENRYTKFGLSASEDFFKMFDFKMLKGNRDLALADPKSIVLTESTAKALFGDKDPLNQLLKIDNKDELKVTGVVADVPNQSSLFFTFILPFSYFESTQGWISEARENWGNNSFTMYVELWENASLEDANASIEYLVRDNNKDEPTARIFLHPMSKWRLHSKFENGKEAGGMIEYVQLFGAIAIFVLVIACINFMNLSTARSEKRAREVGIRKSIGSRRKELIFQFLGESLWVTLISFLLAIMLVELALPAYNLLVNKTLQIEYSNPVWWTVAGTIVILTGLIAGSYPAFYLSSFHPVRVLKGKVHVGKAASTPRKVLVTLQFGFSIFLIIGTWIIYQQIMHVKNREVGYDRQNLLLIWTNTDIETRFQTMKEELIRTGVVQSACKSNSPITRVFASSLVEWPGMDPGMRTSFTSIGTEYDYTETMGIRMLQGRDFSPLFKSDTSAVVVNQAAIDLMGLDNPIGTKIKTWGNEYTIIGVMQNVVMDNPYQPINPLAMFFSPEWSSTISVRLNKTDDFQGAIEKVEAVFKKHDPEHPFSYRFADTEFAGKFSTLDMIGTLAGLFASLAILITCLGLFGLAAFTADQRIKEIGIRKVMGASVSSLMTLICKEFSHLVIFAFVVSAPIAWWGLSGFLKQYPYRIEIHWWVLPAAGVGALALAMLIVGTQAFRAAVSNPVDSLRSE